MQLWLSRRALPPVLGARLLFYFTHEDQYHLRLNLRFVGREATEERRGVVRCRDWVSLERLHVMRVCCSKKSNIKQYISELMQSTSGLQIAL